MNRFIRWHVVLLVFILNACIGNAIFFDIEEQSIVSDNIKRITKIYINNDSTSEMFMLVWNDKQRTAPQKINLLEIDKGYQIFKGWQHKQLEIGQFKLCPNSTYTIERIGGDAAASELTVWTNSSGLVYKSEKK